MAAGPGGGGTRPPAGGGAGAAVSSRDKPFLEAGALVGRYRILKRLGAGSMGEVYLGIDEALGRQAAIKVLGGRHHSNPTLKERFLREARALARLTHQNVIMIFEAGHVGDSERPYFAMELLEGGDTMKLLEERGPLPSGVVALIGAEAAAGLAEAARARIIHRDVKPANLGITAQGILKVTDFGLAKSYAMDKSLTGKGLVVGTADYIAPEQARGDEVDERADVYSLGCSMFHLVTGRPPFRAETGTAVQRYVEVMRAHLTQPVPDPQRFVAGVDEELAKLIILLMSKDREKRPPFDDLAPRLARLASRLGGTLPRLTRRPFTVPTGVPVTRAPETQPAAPTPTQPLPSPAVRSSDPTPAPAASAAPTPSESLPSPARARWPMVAVIAIVVAGLAAAAAALVAR